MSAPVRIPIALVALALIWLSLLAAGCTGRTDALTLDESASGTQVELAPGEDLYISLDSNVTTGYAWSVQELDSAVLQQIGEAEYESDRPVTTGSGGRETFHFQAVAPGETTLLMYYSPSWEEESEPSGSFSLSIIVH